MKNHGLIFAFLALLSAYSARASVRWDGVFLETRFANISSFGTNGAAAAAIPSGGNVAQYPGPDGVFPSATYSETGQTRAIQLRRSTIGHAVAATPVVTKAMLAEGRRLLQEAVGYLETPLSSETAPHSRPAQPWNIRFPGVVDPLNTNNSSFSYTNANFFPDLLVNKGDAAKPVTAADFYRASLRMDPLNLTAAHGLLRVYYERIAAFTYAGHNGAERADRMRLLVGDINGEVEDLKSYTLNFYSAAIDELTLLTSRSLEAQLFEGSYPYFSIEELAPNRDRLTEAYIRALTHQAETIFKLGQLRQFLGYKNPWTDPTALQSFTGLLTSLADDRQAIVEHRLLLELAPELTEAGRIQLGRVGYLAEQIQRLEAAIENGRIAFIAAHDAGTPTSPAIEFSFREYTPEFVPFSALTTKRAHEQFLDTAGDFLARALQREQQAKDQRREFDFNEFAHRSSLSEITNRYFGELGALCGRIESTNGQLIPDVILALYPDSERKSLYSYSQPGESTGEIGAQWSRVDQALAEQGVAEQDLQDIYSLLEKKREVAREIVGGIENLARLFTENGEKLEGLDREEGRLQAEAAMARAKASKGNSWVSGLKAVISVAATAAVTFYTGGAGAPAANSFWAAAGGAGGQGMLAAWDTYEANRKMMKVAGIDAQLARNLAEIAAQRTRIAILEKVAIQHQQRDQVLLQTDEALHALLLQAERQKLTILLAEQRVATEFLALQNLTGRVQYLLQEFANALALQNIDPLASPDYRLVRNNALREAELAFVLAQRWVYLAGKSVEYRVNTPYEFSRLPATISRILQSRNALVLESSLADIRNQLATFYEVGNREITKLTPSYISFRHHLVQRNRLINETNIGTAEIHPGGISSDEHWRRFLLDHTLTSGAGTRRRLVIPFGTSLDKWPESPDPRFKNPLFGTGTHNDALADRGIEIQFLGTGLDLSGLSPRFRLEYSGASAMRLEECASTGGKRIRYWNIRKPDGSVYLAEGEPGLSSSVSWGIGATGFNEFSPANDRWNLIIDGDQGSGAAGNSELLRQLERVTDIRIRFWTSYFPSDDCSN